MNWKKKPKKKKIKLKKNEKEFTFDAWVGVEALRSDLHMARGSEISY